MELASRFNLKPEASTIPDAIYHCLGNIQSSTRSLHYFRRYQHSVINQKPPLFQTLSTFSHQPEASTIPDAIDAHKNDSFNL
ncbi:hypothetical protein BgiMline_012907 [Biomphalaria glabrata]